MDLFIVFVPFFSLLFFVVLCVVFLLTIWNIGRPSDQQLDTVTATCLYIFLFFFLLYYTIKFATIQSVCLGSRSDNQLSSGIAMRPVKMVVRQAIQRSSFRRQAEVVIVFSLF